MGIADSLGTGEKMKIKYRMLDGLTKLQNRRKHLTEPYIVSSVIGPGWAILPHLAIFGLDPADAVLAHLGRRARQQHSLGLCSFSTVDLLYLLLA
jgi:hypothetical protein